MESRFGAFAIVIEPDFILAGIVADVVSRFGYRVSTAGTHAGGAQLALTNGHVQLMVAAVPAPGESRVGAYLAEARKTNPGMHAVIMLSDPIEPMVDAPPNAVKIIKPFNVAALEHCVRQAIGGAISV